MFIKVTRKTIGYYTFLFHRVIDGGTFCVFVECLIVTLTRGDNMDVFVNLM